MIYVCSDLHGHLSVYHKIKAMLNPEDEVYFLGDAGDRGPDSWETIKAIYNDPQFHYIKGNHEDMMVKACREYLIDSNMWDYQTYNLCLWNGGRETLEAWEWDPDRVEWFKKLNLLPTWERIEVCGRAYILCHAGFTPWIPEGESECEIPWDETLIWDRDHYLDDWVDGEMEDVIIVHGHTPIHHLAKDLRADWEDGPFWYADGHKVCIDSGGFFSDEFILLNLNTLESWILTS